MTNITILRQMALLYCIKRQYLEHQETNAPLILHQTTIYRTSRDKYPCYILHRLTNISTSGKHLPLLYTASNDKHHEHLETNAPLILHQTTISRTSRDKYPCYILHRLTNISTSGEHLPLLYTASNNKYHEHLETNAPLILHQTTIPRTAGDRCPSYILHQKTYISDIWRQKPLLCCIRHQISRTSGDKCPSYTASNDKYLEHLKTTTPLLYCIKRQISRTSGGKCPSSTASKDNISNIWREMPLLYTASNGKYHEHLKTNAPLIYCIIDKYLAHLETNAPLIYCIIRQIFRTSGDQCPSYSIQRQISRNTWRQMTLLYTSIN